MNKKERNRSLSGTKADIIFTMKVFFWATEANGFTYPKVKEAIRFSFDKYPSYCYKLNNWQLPFGCHSWYKRKMKKILDGFYSFPIILTTCSSKSYEYIQNINMQYRLLLLFPSRIISPSLIRDAKEIPIIINNF